MDDRARLRVQAMKTLLSAEVDRHQKVFESTNQRDFIDAFLAEISGTSDTESAFHESEGREQLVQTLIDLFVAGTETTSASVAFAVHYMAAHREVQDRVRAEIHDALGHDRFPESSDRQDLPYTEAALLEVVRMANVTPRGLLPHANMAGPVKIGPYTVPEAHTVQASFGLLFNGADSGWADPDKFDPDRFIDEESGKVQRVARLIPFSTGKRQCPAETLATSQVFLFFAALIQRFKFEPVEEAEKAKKKAKKPAELAKKLLAGAGGVTRSPLPEAIKITRVNSKRSLVNNNSK